MLDFPRSTALDLDDDAIRDRMARSLACSPADGKWLGLRTPSGGWLINPKHIGDTLPLPPLRSVPRARNWLRGVTQIGGRLWSVVDLSALLGFRPLPIEDGARLVLMPHEKSGNVALICAEVSGLTEIFHLRPMPLPHAPNWIIESFTDDSNYYWHCLDVERLAESPMLANGLEIYA